jgi:hypothetical protein
MLYNYRKSGDGKEEDSEVAHIVRAPGCQNQGVYLLWAGVVKQAYLGRLGLRSFARATLFDPF